MHCNSWQKGERFFGFSSTLLSLLLALFAVLTVTLPVISRATADHNSSLNFAFEVQTSKTIVILANNRGDRPGVVTGALLDLTRGTTLRKRWILEIAQPSGNTDHSAQIIDPNAASLVTLQSGGAEYAPIPLTAKSCSLTVLYNDFATGPDKKQWGIDCRKIERFALNADPTPHAK